MNAVEPIWITGEAALAQWGVNPWTLGEPGNGNPIRSKLVEVRGRWIRVWLLDDVLATKSLKLEEAP